MKYLWLLISILLLVGSASAAILPPVTPPPIPISGDVNFFFWNDSSDFGSGYNKFATYPQLQDTVYFSQTVSASTGDKTIGSFVTEAFPNGKILAPGLTRYRVYLNTSSAVGLTTFDFIPYNVTSTGIETRMFFGVPRSVDIDSPTPTEYLISYARRNYTEFLPGERLLIKINLSTTSTVSRTGYIGIAGTTTASMGQIGYWLDSSATTNPTNGNESFAYSPSGATPMSVWFIFVFGALLFLIASFSFKLRYADGRVSSERIIFSLLSTLVCFIAALASIEIISPSGIATNIVYQQPLITILFVILSIISFANFIYSVLKSDTVVPENDYKINVDSKVKAEQLKGGKKI